MRPARTREKQDAVRARPPWRDRSDMGPDRERPPVSDHAKGPVICLGAVVLDLVFEMAELPTRPLKVLARSRTQRNGGPAGTAAVALVSDRSASARTCNPSCPATRSSRPAARI